MGSSCLHIYIHFVWYTKGRKPILRGELEKFIHRRIKELSDEQNLQVVAINSAWNHVHVLVRWNATCAIGGNVGRWKGITSHEWEPIGERDQELNWQEGYGAFSIHRSSVEVIKRYIANQKHHHRYNTTTPKWERL